MYGVECRVYSSLRSEPVTYVIAQRRGVAIVDLVALAVLVVLGQRSRGVSR